MLPAVSQKIRLPYPHSGQKAARSQAKRFNLLIAGRRWRKTTLAMSIAVEMTMKRGNIIWGAPTFDQTRIAMDETRRACTGIATFNVSTMRAEMPTGGKIYFRSLDDPDNVRGYTAEGVVVDEVGKVEQRAWQEVLRPMLIDTGGFAWLMGTPVGRNWLWQEYLRCLERADWQVLNAPTLGCAIVDGQLIRKPHPLENPNISWDEILTLFKTLPERTFRQEILAEFVEGGTFFQNVRECATLTPSSPEQHLNHQVYIGGDFAQQDDYTWLTALCATCNQMLEYQRFNQLSWMIQLERIKAFCNKWGHNEKIGSKDLWQPALIMPERNSIGSVLIEQMASAGIPILNGPDGKPGFMTTAQTKQVLVKTLYAQLASMTLKILNDVILIAELESFEEQPTAYGASYSAPSGLHDDGVISLSLANYAAQRAGIQVW